MAIASRNSVRSGWIPGLYTNRGSPRAPRSSKPARDIPERQDSHPLAESFGAVMSRLQVSCAQILIGCQAEMEYNNTVRGSRVEIPPHVI